MTFSTAHFRTAATDSLGDTAIAAALTAARWGVMAWDWYSDTFFSVEATRRYQVMGEILGHCMILVVLGYRMAQLWVDGEVEAAMVDPFSPSVNPLPAPVAVARVKVAPADPMPSIRTLRGLAKGGVVKGASRMSQRALFDALRELGKV